MFFSLFPIPFHLSKLPPFSILVSKFYPPLSTFLFPIYLYIPSLFSSSVRSTEKIKGATALAVASNLSLTLTTTRTCLRKLTFPHVPEPFLPGATLLTLLTLPLNPLSLFLKKTNPLLLHQLQAGPRPLPRHGEATFWTVLQAATPRPSSLPTATALSTDPNLQKLHLYRGGQSQKTLTKSRPRPLSPPLALYKRCPSWGAHCWANRLKWRLRWRPLPLVLCTNNNHSSAQWNPSLPRCLGFPPPSPGATRDRIAHV